MRSNLPQEVAEAVAQRWSCLTETKPFAEIESTEAPFYIFIDSPKHSLMQDMSAATFATLQVMLLRNAGLLCVLPEGGHPEGKSIKGIVHTLRIEHDGKELLLFDDVPRTSQGVSAITRLVGNLRDPEVTRTQDKDFVWHNGSVHVPRLRQVKEAKEQFAVERGTAFRTVQNLWEGDRALEMTIEAAGSADSIYFARTDVLQQPLGDDEILVKVDAAGISYRDLNLVLGSIPWAPPGLEGAGKVVKIGSQVTELREGDRVYFLSVQGSAFATYKKMSSCYAAKVPTGISIAHAASVPLAYSLGVLALFHTAQLKRNETILVHAAASAVGQACIVLAKHAGARIFATAGNEEKRAFLHDTFGIPKENIFSSRAAGFRDGILSATNGRGVDVIVNSLSGELLRETWQLAAKMGRFVDIGKKDALDNGNLPMKPFDSNVTFRGIDIYDLSRNRPELLEEIFSEVDWLFQKGLIMPIKPVTVLPISELQAGLRKLKAGDKPGRIVVSLGKEDKGLAESALHPRQASLKPDVTYLITGGTRGIGLDLAYWMIENGARNIVVLGRSGASGPAVQKLLEQYKGTNVLVRALACDVGSRTEVASVLESIKDLPPVRGVVHSALLLTVCVFLFLFLWMLDISRRQF